MACLSDLSGSLSRVLIRQWLASIEVRGTSIDFELVGSKRRWRLTRRGTALDHLPGCLGLGILQERGRVRVGQTCRGHNRIKEPNNSSLFGCITIRLLIGRISLRFVSVI